MPVALTLTEDEALDVETALLRLKRSREAEGDTASAKLIQDLRCKVERAVDKAEA